MMKKIRVTSEGALVGLLVAAATAGVAAAETLYTKDRTAIRARPGEQARIVVRVGASEGVEVVEREGRWIKVSYQGQTGWVTRTSVRADAEEDAQPDPERQRRQEARRERRRRRERERRAEARAGRDAPDSSFGRSGRDGDAMPIAVKVERARVFTARSRESDVVFTVRRGDELRAGGERDGWFRVRGPGGRQGWIAKGAVGDPEAFAGARDSSGAPQRARDGSDDSPGSLVQERPDGDGNEPTPAAGSGAASSNTRPLELQAGIGAGATSVALDYASDPAASASGFASGVALSGRVTYPLGDALYVGGDIRYLAQLGVSGMSYEAGGSAAGEAGFLLYDLDVGARAGYDFTDTLGAWIRAGYYYNALYVRDLANDAQLPREELTGLTAGLGATAAIGQSIEAELGLGALLLGSHRQTTGLEDGTDASNTTAIWASVGGTYALTPTYAAELRYRLGRHSASWGGASNRISGASDVSRTDLSHQITAGVVATF